MSVNQVILVGRAGYDAEPIHTSNSTSIVKFSLATSKKHKGEETTQWHNIVLFGQPADFALTAVKKGAMVAITGEIRYNKWTDKDGQTRIKTEIVGNQIQVLVYAKDDAPYEPPRAEKMPDTKPVDDFNDDIPF